MPIVRYGNWGHGLLLLPTAQADFLEYERFFLIKALEPLIFAGKVTVFSVDSINKQAWMNSSVHPIEAAHRQSLYSTYIEEEVVPHIRHALRDGGARIGVAGASFGAFHAANQFFRRPDLFDTFIGMSGFYDLTGDYTKGHWNDDFYFNNPTSYVPNIRDPHTLDLIQNHSQIHLITGQGAYEKPEASKRFSTLLWKKGIWNNLDLWGHDMPHDWTTWRQMLPYYVGERLGW